MFCGISLQLLFRSQISQRNLKNVMSHILVDEIARAVLGAVTSVFSQVVEETSGNRQRGRSHDSDSEDFQAPHPKRRKGNKEK